jgi:hypothetical protein
MTTAPTRDEIEVIAYQHGLDAADHYWQLDPAEWDMAVEWVRNADAGTLHNYQIPGPFDEIPADLNTEGWSWSDLADYGGAWELGYMDRTTELCQQLIATYRDNA